MSEHFSGRGGLAGGLSGGVKAAAVALLVHQLMRHARAGQPEAPADTTGTTGGGLGDILGGLFGGGGATTAGGGGLLGGLLGGLGGLLGGLRGQGLGQQVDSWVSQGPNQPVSAAELERSLDPAALDDAARQAGTDRGTLLEELSRMLPQAVDGLTPGGKLPEREAEAGGIGDILRRLAGDGPNPGR
jgi:uncharacterized protein YidB (DUF937 family)